MDFKNTSSMCFEILSQQQKFCVCMYGCTYVYELGENLKSLKVMVFHIISVSYTKIICIKPCEYACVLYSMHLI